MDGRHDLVDCQFSAHRQRVFRNQIGGVRPEDGRAQNLAILADDDLGEALGLVRRQRLAIGRPRELAHLDVGVALARLLLRQADRGNLREGEDWARDDVVVHLRLMAGGVLTATSPSVSATCASQVRPTRSPTA